MILSRIGHSILYDKKVSQRYIEQKNGILHSISTWGVTQHLSVVHEKFSNFVSAEFLTNVLGLNIEKESTGRRTQLVAKRKLQSTSQEEINTKIIDKFIKSSQEVAPW